MHFVCFFVCAAPVFCRRALASQPSDLLNEMEIGNTVCTLFFGIICVNLSRERRSGKMGWMGGGGGLRRCWGEGGAGGGAGGNMSVRGCFRAFTRRGTRKNEPHILVIFPLSIGTRVEAVLKEPLETGRAFCCLLLFFLLSARPLPGKVVCFNTCILY